LHLRGIVAVEPPAERQVQLAHPPVQMRTHEPPSQPTEMWAGGCEIDFVVNLERLARPVVCHFVFQANPVVVPNLVDHRLKSRPVAPRLQASGHQSVILATTELRDRWIAIHCEIFLLATAFATDWSDFSRAAMNRMRARTITTMICGMRKAMEISRFSPQCVRSFIATLFCPNPPPLRA
jgi:hypothetical protein